MIELSFDDATDIANKFQRDFFKEIPIILNVEKNEFNNNFFTVDYTFRQETLTTIMIHKTTYKITLYMINVSGFHDFGFFMPDFGANPLLSPDSLKGMKCRECGKDSYDTCYCRELIYCKSCGYTINFKDNTVSRQGVTKSFDNFIEDT